MDYLNELKAAVDAARAAGDLLLKEFNRPGGPRGQGGHCPADEEAEAIIRQRLGAEFPDYGMVGEELPAQDREPKDPQKHVWVIDPNDGTSAFQKGWRGAAVSIALLRKGLPVLGVVYAYAGKAGRGDLFTWAEGQAFQRNGRTMGRRPAAAGSGNGLTVIVSQSADGKPEINAEFCQPARFRAEPGIAYRLALAAAGEGVAGVSLNSPTAWDVAAGHALLRAAGGDLYRLGGRPATYSGEGRGFFGDCVGGVGPFARELALREWELIRRGRPTSVHDSYGLLRPDPAKIVSDPGLLSRAQGCLIGQLAGDNLGALVEFQTAAEIARRYPGGPRLMEDGGHWDILAGQPTDDSELALMLARSIADEGHYNIEVAARAYAWWYAGGPFDIGGTTRNALEPALAAVKAGGSAADAAKRAALNRTDSEANGALMRAAPLAVFGHGMKPDDLARLARQDAELTHANPVCRDANAVYCVAVAAAVGSHGDRKAVYDYALEWARACRLCPSVVEAVTRARTSPPADFQRSMGWVLIALQNAFYRLLHAPSPEEGIAQTIACGGDTDTNAAIAGALLGAAFGAEAFPHQWVDRLLTCRAMRATAGCRRPRPPTFWPVDCLILAERLAWLGAAGR
jgi:ADP-ribosylglycohydrolase/fructose-1,6-bisphosphatase/inositol monophosphatase family enzyme